MVLMAHTFANPPHKLIDQAMVKLRQQLSSTSSSRTQILTRNLHVLTSDLACNMSAFVARLKCRAGLAQIGRLPGKRRCITHEKRAFISHRSVPTVKADTFQGDQRHNGEGARKIYKDTDILSR
jgi:hypothetical protein